MGAQRGTDLKILCNKLSTHTFKQQRKENFVTARRAALWMSRTEWKEFCAPPVREKSEVADAHKTARQQVQEEAAKELFDRQGHEPLPCAGCCRGKTVFRPSRKASRPVRPRTSDAEPRNATGRGCGPPQARCRSGTRPVADPRGQVESGAPHVGPDARKPGDTDASDVRGLIMALPVAA